MPSRGLGFCQPMADSSTSPKPSKAMVFASRSGSTLFLWALVAAVFVSHWTWAYLGLLSLLILIATIEYFRMLKTAKVPCFPLFGILCALGYCVASYGPVIQGKPPLADIDVLALAIVTIGAFTLQLRRPIQGILSLQSVAANVLGFAYIVILFNFAARLLFIAPDATAVKGVISNPSSFLLLWLIAVTKFTDMGAYITGSLIGKHKMIPHVSPAKTWEGFGGALVFAQLAGIGLFFGFREHLEILGSLSHVIILGLLLAVLAVIGDLAESIVKRALDAKDSGHMLPGIGGSLDLIDSICFTAPALFFYIEWFLLPRA